MNSSGFLFKMEAKKPSFYEENHPGQGVDVEVQDPIKSIFTEFTKKREKSNLYECEDTCNRNSVDFVELETCQLIQKDRTQKAE